MTDSLLVKRKLNFLKYKKASLTRKMSGNKEVYFLHIPKTGGTYVMQSLTSTFPVIWPIWSLGHTKVYHESEEELKGYPLQGVTGKPHKVDFLKNKFIFTTVRNPYSWLVSYYNWHTHPAKKYDNKLTKKGFDFFLKTIAERDSKEKWPGKKMLFFQVFSTKGDLLIDWANRMETLDSDLEAMAKEKNLSYIKAEKQRVNPLSKKKDYRSFYNSELTELVQKTWKFDLDLFGYHFDGYDPEKALIRNKVSPELKNKIKYSWDSNEIN